MKSFRVISGVKWSKETSSLTMGTGMIPETFVSLDHLTRLMGREDFITSSLREEP
jgi:hypothetical protein